jgi:hypothetical protein
MRKCPDCGYLVFGDGAACKHCGEPLPPGAFQANPAPALVASGAPPAPLMSVPPVPPPDARGGTPVAPPVPAMEQTYWNAPAPIIAPPARKSPRSLVAVVCVIAMALGWVAVEHQMHSNSLPTGTSEFVAGRGVSYASPDHTFDARFPATPTVESRVIPLSTHSATIHMAQLQTNDYEIVAASMVLPVALPAGQVGPVLHDVLTKAATDQGDTITGQSDVTQQGVPGIDVHVKVHDGYSARFLVLMSGSRIYLLGVHAKRGTDRLYNALVSSLIMY